jgi:hypothetical protein
LFLPFTLLVALPILSKHYSEQFAPSLNLISFLLQGSNFALFAVLAFTLLVALPTLVIFARRLAAAPIFASAAAVFSSQPPSLQTVYPAPQSGRLQIHSLAAAIAAALNWPSTGWYFRRISYVADVLLEKHPFT